MRTSVALSALAAFILLVIAPVVSAQVVLPNIENALSITITPAHPPAGASVHMVANSSVLDLSKSHLVWMADGKSFADGLGRTSADITAGALGEETDITLQAIDEDGTGASASAAIIPAGVDLLYDSDSYVPPFYRGRALATAGAVMRFQAVPFFKLPGKTLIPADQLIYTWKKNNIVLPDLSGRGRSSALIPSLHIFGSDTISVEVATDDDALTSDASMVIPSQQAMLMLYQDHPLYGVMFNRALAQSSFFQDTEVTLAAIPYFAPVSSPDSTALAYAWNVNDADIAPNSAHPSELTLSAGKTSSAARVRLALTHATDYLLDVRDAWLVALGTSANAFQSVIH